MNFPQITVNKFFKSQAQDSALEYLFCRFWKVGSVTCQPIIAFSSVDLTDIAIRTFVCVHLFSPVHSGAFCQFLFRWITYCHSSKTIGKETGKMHLSPVRPTRKKRRKRRELDSPAQIVDLFLRAPMSSVAAAPWARATKNVKKPQNQMCESCSKAKIKIFA